MLQATQEDVKALVEGLNFKEKVERSLSLIEQAYKEYADALVVANSLGKDSVAVWHLGPISLTLRPRPISRLRLMGT